MSLLRTCKVKDMKKCVKEFRRDNYDLKPKVLKKNKNYELWHKKDRSFLVSRVNFFTKFIFPKKKSVSDPKYSVLLKIFVYGIKNQFRNFIYEQKMNQSIFFISPKAK